MAARSWFIALAALIATTSQAQTNGSAAGGQSANQSTLSGCRYRASPPTLTDGQQMAFRCDTNGGLIFSSTLGFQSDLYGWDGAEWQKLQAILNGSAYSLGIDETTSSQLHTDLVSAVTAGTNRIGYTSDDPCTQLTKSNADFESTSSGGQVAAGVAAKFIYVCSITATVSTQTNFSLCDSATTGCTNAVFLNTGTTAANGANLGQSATVGGGLTFGNGSATIAKTTATGNNLTALFVTTNTPQVNIHVSYVTAP